MRHHKRPVAVQLNDRIAQRVNAQAEPNNCVPSRELIQA